MDAAAEQPQQPPTRGRGSRQQPPEGGRRSRLPGLGRQAQPPVSQPPRTGVPSAANARTDTLKRSSRSQPPADRLPAERLPAERLPQQPGPGQGSGPRPVIGYRQDSQPLVPPRPEPQPQQQPEPRRRTRLNELQRNGRSARNIPPLSAQPGQDSGRHGRQDGSGSSMAPVGPGSRNGITPLGPGSRAGMTPVSPPSQPRITPVSPPSQPRMSPVNQPSQSRMTPVARPRPPAPPGARPPVDLGNAVTTVTKRSAGSDGPERREDIDPTCLTSEMEPISDVVEQKRKVDATLARFSAVHDEMAAEERQRRSRRMKLMPWLSKDDDLEEALSKGTPVSPATANQPRLPDEIADPEPQRGVTSLADRLKPKRGATWKVASGVAAVLVLIACFFGWRSINNVTSQTNQIQEVAALDENSPAIISGGKQYGDSNFLVVGTNARPGTSSGPAQVTDTIMVVHIPGDGSRAVVVSFPPNLSVDRPQCQQWNNQTNNTAGNVPAQTGVKLSSIYSIGGPRCVTDTVQQLTGLRINHFLGIDDSGFNSLLGGVQGVQLCVKQPLHDAQLGTIIPQAGQVTLSGKQALNYVQADNVTGDTQLADLSKITRQQRFLAAVLRKTIGQQNLLMDPSGLNNFLGTFTTSTFGDNTGVDQLVKLAQSLQGLALGKITFVTVPTSTTLDAAGQETLTADSAKQLFAAIINNSALPGEQGATAGSTSQNVTPQDIKIQVLNGIGDSASGVAGQTANALKPFGYQIAGVGGPTPTVTQTVIKYAAGQQSQAELLASSVPSATLQVDPSMDGAIQLIIGPGFNHVVQAPHAGGASGAQTSGSQAPTGLAYVNAADTSCA